MAERLRAAPAGRLRRTTPILPARDVAESAAFYRDMLGFAVVHAEDR